MRLIGLMSGTSADGIDAALLRIRDGVSTLEAVHSEPLPGRLARQIRAISRHPTGGTLDASLTLDLQLGACFARAALTLVRRAALRPAAIHAIGLHGQTLRHRPKHRYAYSLQMANAQRVALETGILTVADWRMRDILLGGEGAPLVPLFHAAQFSAPDETRAVLNLGGIANLTLLDAAGRIVAGFDCGPANCLMDAWTRRHQGFSHDADGAWARTGRVLPGLLMELLAEPYFAARPPKSTGLDRFNPGWLQQVLARSDTSATPADVQRTLLELTVESVATALEQMTPSPQRLLVCGGGAHNGFVMERLADRLRPVPVASTASLGWDPEWIEAAAFAWLAYRTMNGEPGNAPAVTGAQRAGIMGAVFLPG